MKKKNYYYWVIVLACCLLMASATGLLSYLNALFIVPATEELGVSRATFMIYSSCSTVVTMCVMPFIGSVFKKIPMKFMIMGGALLAALAHFCYSSATSVTLFYIGGAIAGLANCCMGAIPVTTLIANWFNDKRGIVTGIAFSGSSIVTSILSPVMSNMIETYGWRVGFRCISIAILCVVIPTALFLIRVNPAEMGLEPYGKKKESSVEKEKVGFTKGQVFKTVSFWIFVLITVMLGFISTPTQKQLAAYWVDEGNTAVTAAAMYSVVTGVSIFSKILLGAVYDRVSIKAGTTIIGCIAVSSFITLILFPTGQTMVIPAVLFGLTTAMQVLVPTFVMNKMFGDKEYSSIYGILTPVLYLGITCGTPFSAKLFDIFGTYKNTWAIYGVLMIFVVVFICICDSVSKKEFKKILGVERK